MQPVRYILRRFDEDRLGGLEDILSENKKNKDWREIFGALSTCRDFYGETCFKKNFGIDNVEERIRVRQE